MILSASPKGEGGFFTRPALAPGPCNTLAFLRSIQMGEYSMAVVTNKVAFVTGAARGLGLAAATKFLDEGWRVVMLDILGDVLEEAASTLGSPERILTIRADVSDPAAVREAVQKAKDQFGRIDALVNNAGIAVFKPILEVSLEDWQRVMAVNLTGPFLMTQAIAPLMRDQGGGAIVNITSISGLRASTLRVAYGTSKAGLAHLTKQQAAELGEYGIRVNAVAPGPVDTAMAKAVHTPEIRADYHDHMPLNRYGLESELANAIYFLCSDQATFVTGQILCVDGGFDSTGIGLPTMRGQRKNS